MVRRKNPRCESNPYIPHPCTRAPGFPLATIAAASRTSTPTSLFRVAAAQADPRNGIPSSHWCLPAWPRRLQLAGVPPPALQAEEFERSGGTISNSGAQILWEYVRILHNHSNIRSTTWILWVQVQTLQTLGPGISDGDPDSPGLAETLSKILC